MRSLASVGRAAAADANVDFAQLVHQLFPQLRSAVAQQLGADPQLWHTLAVSLLADYPDLERDDLLAALEFGALAAGRRRVVPLGAA